MGSREQETSKPPTNVTTARRAKTDRDMGYNDVTGDGTNSLEHYMSSARCNRRVESANGERRKRVSIASIATPNHQYDGSMSLC